MFLSYPQISAPKLLSILGSFAYISGLIAYPNKLKALNISLAPTELWQAMTSLPFAWVSHHLPYLGVQLTASAMNLFSVNYLPLLKQVTSLMAQWSSLPLAWLGRVNATKMSILPKFLYLFRVLPIPVPSYFLHLTQSRVMTHIWAVLKPWIPKSSLFLPKPSGGLRIPHFSSYYYAAQLAQLPKYHAAKETPLWVAVESVDCDPISVANVLWLHPK